MLRRKKVFGFIFMVCLLIALAACAPQRNIEQAGKTGGNESKSDQSSQNNGDDSSAMPEKPDKLIMWANDAEEQIEALKKITQRYTEKTGIKVKVEKVSMLDQQKKLALAGPAGNGADLIYQPHDRLGDLVAQGLVKPIDFSKDELSGYSKAAVQAFSFDGAVYAAPAVIETYALYYNKKLIPTVPETFEDLFAAAKPLTHPDQDKYGFLMEENFYYNYIFFKNHGGYIFGGEPGSYDTSDIGLNNEGAVAGGKQYQKYFTEGLIPVSVTGDVLNGLFTEGKVGMVISGPWNIPSYSEALGDQLGSAQLPKINGETAHSFVGVKGWLVSYYSKHPKWAADLAKFITNDESAETYFAIAGEMPPRPKVLDSLDKPIYKGFTEQIKYGVPMPNVPEMSQVWGPMNDAMKFLAQGKDVEKVLDQAVQQIKQKIQASGQ
ncbi:MAG TPA: extracellular solute-binding protein [Bacillales bacterium]|nr:extracellular solute-binding protein [Bacillales bacterium]